MVEGATVVAGRVVVGGSVDEAGVVEVVGAAGLVVGAAVVTGGRVVGTKPLFRGAVAGRGTSSVEVGDGGAVSEDGGAKAAGSTVSVWVVGVTGAVRSGSGPASVVASAVRRSCAPTATASAM